MNADGTLLLWAVALGALSGISLPLGSFFGLWLRPRASIAALLGAFGAGALIAALALDLVSPSALALEEGGHEAVLAFYALLGGAVTGGLLFVVLDRALAERGAFLRKMSTTLSHLARSERSRRTAMLKDICSIPLIRAFPAAQINELVGDVETAIFADGQRLYSEGDAPDSLYFVVSGNVELERSGSPLQTVAAGGILGELPVISGIPRSMSATAQGVVRTYRLSRRDFLRWCVEIPGFEEQVRAMAATRLEEIRQRDRERGEEEQRWGEEAVAALHVGAEVPSPQMYRQMAGEHGGAGLAVWLGMVIDGIPESLVIGSGLFALVAGRSMGSEILHFADIVPYTLIAGLFLSNFPEALSSSLGMRAQGWSAVRVFSLWLALFVITAVGAGLGYVLGETVPHTVFAWIEGMAAGAMLTTIASTMIPEAVQLGGSGSRVGLATLAGFLAATAFKLLE